MREGRGYCCCSEDGTNLIVEKQVLDTFADGRLASRGSRGVREIRLSCGVYFPFRCTLRKKVRRQHRATCDVVALWRAERARERIRENGGDKDGARGISRGERKTREGQKEGEPERERVARGL